MNVIPLKIGVQLDSPALVYIYKQSGSLRMRRMPLRNFWANTDVEFVLEDIRSRHGDHIAEVPDRALRRMLNIIKQSKQGKSLKEILSTSNSNGESRIERDEIIFSKLKNNLKSDLSKEFPNANKEEIGKFRKKEFPQRTSFTTLYDSEKFNSKNKENTIESTSRFSGDSFLHNKKRNGLKLDENIDTPVQRPNTLELNKFELSTSFNTFSPQDKKTNIKKSGILQDLEKDLAKLDFPEKDKTDETSEKITPRKGFTRASEKKNAKLVLRNEDKQGGTVREKRDDDTDVEFDDSDNPLDDPEEDFW